MPTRKIADLTPVCRHREHDPPSMMVYEDGVYEHECPGCGHKQRFVVRKPSLRLPPREDEARWLVTRRSGSDRSLDAATSRSRPGSLDARLR
jgi:Zn ribbon nucleic-acid-binding protein